MTDADRLRELQRRAFAPGGSLTPAEEAELRALTRTPERGPDAGVVTPQDPDAGAAEPQHPHPAEEAEPQHPDATMQPRAQENPRHAAALGDSDSPETAAPDPSAGAGSRASRPALMIIAAAVLLLLGFGTGWLVFARDDLALSLSAEQRSTWTELEASGAYDAGSIEFTGTQDELTAWYATQDDGKRLCMILTAGEQREPTCLLADNADPSDGMLQASFQLPAVEGENPVMFWVMMLRAAGGEMVSVIQRVDDSNGQYDWREQYIGAERAIAEMLDGAGFDGEMLQIVGYDGDTPVWLTYKDQACILLADAESILVQGCGYLGPDNDLQVSAGDVTYSVHQSDLRGPVLTITRIGATFDVETGQHIDDKTGEIGE